MNAPPGPRRDLLQRLALIAMLPVATSWPRPPVAVAAQSPGLAQASAADRRGHVARAFEMRRLAETQGDQSYGAVVVKDGRVVAEAPSRVVTRGDPTAHAEMEAIREACRRLGTRRLAGCELYSSSRPCPMCEAAAYWAGIDRMIHGADATDGGAPRLASC